MWWLFLSIMTEQTLVKVNIGGPSAGMWERLNNQKKLPEWYKFISCSPMSGSINSTRDRTDTLINPFVIDNKYRIPLPENLEEDISLSECMNNRAIEINNLSSDKYIDVFLSGGIDSTALYAAFLKTCDIKKVRACFIFDDDTKNYKALNNANKYLYNYVIKNKYPYRIMYTSDIHPDDSVSVIGQPGNRLSNSHLPYVESFDKSLGIKLECGDYDNEPWEKLIGDFADILSECNKQKVLEELYPFVTSTMPREDLNNGTKVYWWFKFIFNFENRSIGPWYFIKDLSLDRADKVFSFYASNEFQRHIFNNCYLKNKYMKVSDGRNQDVINYMLDFYNDQNLVDYTYKFPVEGGVIHEPYPKGIIRLGNGDVLDYAEYLEREEELKGLFNGN